MRYLSIDLGDKRTGLAVGDDETNLVSPERVLEIPVAQQDRLLTALKDAADDFGVGAVVIGLPLNMDDTEGPRAKGVRAIGDAFSARTGMDVHYQDERLTSADANWSMAQSGLTHAQKKRRRDALAAAAILRDFLDR